LILLALLAASCTTAAPEVRSPADLPPAFSATGDAAMPDQWWTAFGDADLDALVGAALAGNFGLRVAWDRLDQAAALQARAASPLWPSLDATAGASRSRVEPGPGRADRVYATEWSLGALASYEADLWGSIRNGHEAARLDVIATDADVHAAAVTLAAETAATWFTLLEQRGQLTLLDAQTATNERYLEIITLRFRRGQVSATDVLQQRQLVERTRGLRKVVEAAIGVLQHRLAVLAGRAPGAWTAPPGNALPDLPPLPAAGVPASLVERRPDVSAARLRVQAADRRVAVAIADQFPRLGITIRAETDAAQLRDLFDNWLAALAANIAAPLFDGGLRRSEVRRTRAVLSERVNTYGQAVLVSLGEVEDALVQEARQTDFVASLREQLTLAETSTRQTQENYTKGSMDFIRYLTTLLAYQDLQRTVLAAERDLVLFRVDLYRALAGRWDLERPAPLSEPRP
jgi:NodT family efflux transporter outer membrane factor (OMF) lipoprotein